MTRSENVYTDHLKELHSSEFEMAPGEPDIRNWKVIGLQNQEIGKVEELLFNELSHRVRYLIINVNGKPLNLISRAVLIPVGLVDLLKDEKIVLVRGLTLTHLASLPTYEKGKLSRDTELEIREVFAPGNVGIYQGKNIIDDEEFYDNEYDNSVKPAHPNMRVTEKNTAKEEIRDNIERVKESVRKMENELEKLDKSDQ